MKLLLYVGVCCFTLLIQNALCQTTLVHFIIIINCFYTVENNMLRCMTCINNLSALLTLT